MRWPFTANRKARIYIFFLPEVRGGEGPKSLNILNDYMRPPTQRDPPRPREEHICLHKQGQA